MDPKALLIDWLGGLWNLINNHGYVYIIVVVVAGVLLYKLVKLTFKTVLKVGGVLVAIFVVIKLLSMFGIGG